MEFFHTDVEEECIGGNLIINIVREGNGQEDFEDESDEGSMVSIIVEFGADASLFPGHRLGKGK